MSGAVSGPDQARPDQARPDQIPTAGAFGAYGKLPALGDFFRITLPRGFIDPWDGFLQGAMTGGRARLGGRWNDCYLTAPIWRFTLAGGLAGPDPVIGVMMASIDRVGRQFPLTLAATLPGSRSALLDHFIATPTFLDLEGIALGALDDAMTREALAARLAPLGARAGRAEAALSARPGTLVAVGAGAQGLLTDLAAGLAGARFARPSVWSADVTGGLRLMVCEGLPDADQAEGLFDLDAPVWSGRAPAPAAPAPAAPAPEPAPAPAARIDTPRHDTRPPPPKARDAGPDTGPDAAPAPDPGYDPLEDLLSSPEPGTATEARADPDAGADLIAQLLSDGPPDDDTPQDDTPKAGGDDDPTAPPSPIPPDGQRKDPAR